MLIAKEIEFSHPISGEIMKFEVDYTDYFKDFLISDEI